MSELVRNMLDNLLDDNQAAAQDNFNDAIALKVTDVLDQRKTAIAKSMGANNVEV